MRKAGGFTLVELLVVVAILSAVTVASFGLVSEDRAQVRIDDTRNRLKTLRRAVLGAEAPVWNGEMRLSGYVADNGMLPDSIGDLLRRPAALNELKGVIPALSTTAGTCVQPTGDGTPVIEARLLKGHRGNYLAGLVHNDRFRDGWGNVVEDDTEDAKNSGWAVTTPFGDGLTIMSLGADNVANSVEPEVEAEKDQKVELSPPDWKVALDGWQVKLTNVAPAPVNAGDPDNAITGPFSLALLVFENIGAGGRWRQFWSQGGTCGNSLEAEGDCVLTFTNVNGCGGGATEVPLGRHVLVLTVGGALPATGSGMRKFAQVDFFPGALPPNLVWKIRP